MRDDTELDRLRSELNELRTYCDGLEHKEIDTETDFETDTLVVKLYARGVFDKSVKASEMTSWLIELP